MTLPFRGVIQGGKIQLDSRDAFQAHIQSLEGKAVSLTLKQWRSQRSNPQNKYYWGVVLKVLGDHTGYHADELHEALKLRFLQIDPDAPLVVAKSTTELNTQEFAEYLDRVIQLAAELGCVVPDAG